MATSKLATRPEPSRRFEQRLALHKQEVALLREKLGDPQMAFFSFVRDRFDAQAFLPDEKQRTKDMVEGNDDDDLDAW